MGRMIDADAMLARAQQHVTEAKEEVAGLRDALRQAEDKLRAYEVLVVDVKSAIREAKPVLARKRTSSSTSNSVTRTKVARSAVSKISKPRRFRRRNDEISLVEAAAHVLGAAKKTLSLEDLVSEVEKVVTKAMSRKDLNDALGREAKHDRARVEGSVDEGFTLTEEGMASLTMA